MIQRAFITESSLAGLIGQLAESGRRVLGPVRSGNRVMFKEVCSMEEVDKDHIVTTVSPKEALLPRCEEIVRWKNQGKETLMADENNPAVPTVVYGLRPCDARSVEALHAVYTWDTDDGFFLSKYDTTTFITLSCRHCDEHCFCVATGGGPGDTAGSDLLLTALEDGLYLVEIVSEKGQALADENDSFFTMAHPGVMAGSGAESGRGAAANPGGATQSGATAHSGAEAQSGATAQSGTTAAPSPDQIDKESYLADVEKHFDLETLRERLEKAFDGPVWEEQSLRCLGCGACAFVCPTCSCFDIQDETYGTTGQRLRCWDTCGLGQFTIHTSGHNPRETQAQRWRQRIMHKFSYGYNRLNITGCVGCGRCSRACPADMNLAEHLIDIAGAK